jgi:hypothetical protein
MILLLLIVSIMLSIVGFLVMKKDTKKSSGFWGGEEIGTIGSIGIGVGIFSSTLSFVFILMLLCSISDLVNTRSYDAEIAVIQEQNTSLEEKISACVLAYLEHEGKTYDSLTPDKALAYATALPELSSNVLVQEQIGVYKENRDSLQKLLIKKARVSALRYKVYFGK